MAYCCTCAEDSLFQSTPPARGATYGKARCWCMVRISIHAPREGGDGGIGIGNASRAISIHAPREGGDTGRLSISFFYRISIHAPREGGDQAAAPGASC